MNAPEPRLQLPALATRLLALLAPEQDQGGPPATAGWLRAQAALWAQGPIDLDSWVQQWLDDPPQDDRVLAQIARLLSLDVTECMALVLCQGAATQGLASRAIAWLTGGERTACPTPGLLATLDQRRGLSAAASLCSLLDGQALASGLLQLDSRERALPDARLHIPTPTVLCLAGGTGHWPHVTLDSGGLPALVPTLRAEAARQAHLLLPGAALLVRSGHPREARAACAQMAAALGRRAAFIEGEPAPGLLPWLLLQQALPVLLAETSPGETFQLPDFVGTRLPMLVAGGPDGNAALRGQTLPSWTVPVPADVERAALWRDLGADADSAWQLGAAHRHACARIDELARAAGPGPGTAQRVARLARGSGQGALGSLAQLLPEDIPEQALVLPPGLRRELHELASRCRLREVLADGLGVAARSRYRAGVRALFVGPSGTGKTLAGGWLATQLGLPLYRVDLASVSSKYIGETEKNLSQLFARAETAEVVLLFDEADAMFGKRTEVKDANDRYANQQTNYLLQRIEDYDGIVVLTSNSRSRFDAAFTRRLDVILEFPHPAPAERRALWLAHMGLGHELSDAELNRLAASCDLAGGQVRNATLRAALAARGARRNLHYADLLQGIAAEYRKLGRTLPAGLSDRPGEA
ncbi:AAA+ family ATPase [Burkholderiales bacterium JOSHI_001]|nr:AAA+ family ATPase [Burkholderiales bacterium JOSHI_001]